MLSSVQFISIKCENQSLFKEMKIDELPIEGLHNNTKYETTSPIINDISSERSVNLFRDGESRYKQFVL